MRIIHVAFECHYTEGMMYQQNIMAEYNVQDGHEVMVISDIGYFQNGKLIYGDEEDRITNSGIRLVRLKYDFLLCTVLSNKVRKCHKLKQYLDSFCPDVIMFHSVSGYELMTVAEYRKKHPYVLFYADTHADYYHSATSLISKIFHSTIYRMFIKKSIGQIEKIFYISVETKIFLKEMYHVTGDKTEFLPLGGIIVSEEEQNVCREEILQKYSLPSNALIFAHSGKLEEEKRTKELLLAWEKLSKPTSHLLIMGSIPQKQQPILEPLISRLNNVHYLGWKRDDEMRTILAGSDVYCQPGIVSATFQVAVCAGCAILAYPYPIYLEMLPDGFIPVKNINDIERAIDKIQSDNLSYMNVKKTSYAYAVDKLDYHKIANRICR